MEPVPEVSQILGHPDIAPLVAAFAGFSGGGDLARALGNGDTVDALQNDYGTEYDVGEFAGYFGGAAVLGKGVAKNAIGEGLEAGAKVGARQADEVLDAMVDRFTRANGVEAAEIAGELATKFTRGSGSRVVLGEWVANGKALGGKGGGYLGEAIENGGIYFESSSNFYAKLVAQGGEDFAKERSWMVNKAFLKQQLRSGVSRFDFTDGGIAKAFGRNPGAVRMEFDFLKRTAPSMGYQRFGNSWIRQQ